MICMTSKEEREINKRIMPAISIIALMLLSTQLSIMPSSDDSPERTRSDDTPKRTAYQQLEQLGGPVQGESQSQPATTNPFQAAAFHDPFYNDPAAIYGKVSDTSALTLDPSYGFFLEETNTEDHDNDGGRCSRQSTSGGLRQKEGR